MNLYEQSLAVELGIKPIPENSHVSESFKNPTTGAWESRRIHERMEYEYWTALYGQEHPEASALSLIAFYRGYGNHPKRDYSMYTKTLAMPQMTISQRSRDELLKRAQKQGASQ